MTLNNLIQIALFLGVLLAWHQGCGSGMDRSCMSVDRRAYPAMPRHSKHERQCRASRTICQVPDHQPAASACPTEYDRATAKRVRVHVGQSPDDGLRSIGWSGWPTSKRSASRMANWPTGSTERCRPRSRTPVRFSANNAWPSRNGPPKSRPCRHAS